MRVALLPLLLALPALAACTGRNDGDSDSYVTGAKVDQLVRAFPDAADLPGGWSVSGSTLTPEPEEGDSQQCGTRNGAARAADSNTTGFILSRDFRTDDGDFAYMGLASFPDTASADRFMDATLDDAGCGSRTYTQSEADRDEYEDDSNVFGEAIWDVTETVSIGATTAEDADRAFFITIEEAYDDTVQGKSFGGRRLWLIQFEQYGANVATYFIVGNCCGYGFDNANELSRLPNSATLAEFADTVRDRVTAGLLAD